MPRAGIIFDFDGTLALSEPVHMQAWRDLAVAEGHELPHGFLEKGVGATDAELVLDLAEAWPGASPADEMLQRKRENYQARCATQSVLVPGIEAALERWSQRLPLGIATSASAKDIAPTLDRFKIRRFFPVILTIESVERAKPDPEIYLKAAMLLGIEPSRTVVFEDSPVGAQAGRAAGMQVIGMTTTFPAGAIGSVVMSIPNYLDLARIEAVLGF